MEKQKTLDVRIIQCLLGIIMVGSFLFFVLGEVLLPPENETGENSFSIYEGTWEQILENDSRVVVEVPGTCEVERGAWGTISTMLPMEQADTWMCIRSMQQELRIYVGDELRKEYSTLETQPFGKTSTMTYVFWEMYKEDAGKELRIEFMSDSSYANYVSEVYCGELHDIVNSFVGLYAPAAVVSLLVFIVGFLVVVISVFVCMAYKRDVELIHLGNVLLVCASWLLVESKIRQFIFPNSTIAMLMGFLMIAILPYPFIAYINAVQKNRYHRFYSFLGVATVINCVLVVLLQVLQIKDFFETMTSSHIIIVVLIIAMGVTIFRDIKNGYVHEYREVAIGFGCLMLAGLMEISLTYTNNARNNGIPLCIGLVVLLIAAGLKAIRDTLNVEKEKQSAVAASESRAQFLANMSHEIRTPINTIIGMNEMIIRESKEEVVGEYAQNIKGASQMLLGLINDVLDMSKIEAGKLEIVENEYVLANMLRDVVLGMDVRLEEKHLELKLEMDEDMPSVLKGDDIRIKQILNNLLSNAVKYTETGSITFIAKGISEESGFSLLLSVEDTGIGIKEQDLERLFDSFQRLELSKNRYIEGTGLGLNITKRLVDEMKGTLEVHSTYGQGSCFTVRIPQMVVDETPMGSIQQKPAQTAMKKEETETAVLCIPNAEILVVDDTKMNLKVIQALLKRTQAKVDTAASGTECLELTKEKQYDLILMDHMMPEPDGIETLHLIREDDKNLNINTPIVVLTANAIAGMKEQYLEEGFADYLSKPVDVERLEETLKRFLG